MKFGKNYKQHRHVGKNQTQVFLVFHCKIFFIYTKYIKSNFQKLLHIISKMRRGLQVLCLPSVFNVLTSCFNFSISVAPTASQALFSVSFLYKDMFFPPHSLNLFFLSVFDGVKIPWVPSPDCFIFSPSLMVFLHGYFEYHFFRLWDIQI